LASDQTGCGIATSERELLAPNSLTSLHVALDFHVFLLSFSADA